ncbi:MAG TPA: glycosyltransferase family 4 protein [Pyrinomonadaceae bacterium]|nr:glycosyltransferase family 4 protein [Pyrinomonadaceae bacterium]
MAFNESGRAARGPSKSGLPLHLLIVSNTDSTAHISGGDRDWVNLLNAFGPERVRATWVGPRGTKLLRPYFDQRITVRFLDVPFPGFYTFFHEAMYQPRSWRTWLGIIKRQTSGLRRPLGSLRQSLRNDRPDVVITATSVELIGVVYAWLERLPHVWSVKEFLDPAVAGCRRYAWLIEKLSNEVIVPSQAMAGAFSKRVRVLRDGSDLEAIRRTDGQSARAEVLQSLDLPSGQPLIVQVGDVSWAKGQQVTAQACAQLAREGTPCSVLFLGFCPNDLKEKLLDILSNAPAGRQSSVRFVQFESGDFSYLRAADIVVHPSVLPDPYPNAVREALSLGKAVIGARVGGIPELISDEVTGLLVEPEDPQQLAGALRRLIDSPEERARLGEKARHFADAKLDIDRCKDAFFELLLSVSVGEPPGAKKHRTLG